MLVDNANIALMQALNTHPFLIAVTQHDPVILGKDSEIPIIPPVNIPADRILSIYKNCIIVWNEDRKYPFFCEHTGLMAANVMRIDECNIIYVQLNPVLENDMSYVKNYTDTATDLYGPNFHYLSDYMAALTAAYAVLRDIYKVGNVAEQNERYNSVSTFDQLPIPVQEALADKEPQKAYKTAFDNSPITNFSPYAVQSTYPDEFLLAYYEPENMSKIGKEKIGFAHKELPIPPQGSVIRAVETDHIGNVLPNQDTSFNEVRGGIIEIDGRFFMPAVYTEKAPEPVPQLPPQAVLVGDEKKKELDKVVRALLSGRKKK